MEVAPSFRGRLTLKGFRDWGFLGGLSRPSGGLAFRYIDLGVSPGARFHLGSCAETLEMLRVYCGGDRTNGEGWSRVSRSLLVWPTNSQDGGKVYYGISACRKTGYLDLSRSLWRTSHVAVAFPL